MTKVLYVNLNDDEHAELKERAWKRRKSMSELVRDVLFSEETDK